MDPFQKYRNASIATTDPLQQLVFVFDEVLKLLYATKKALGEKDYETKYRNLTKAVDIFYILRSGIDENIGEAMQILGKFYDSTIYNLHQANIKFDTPEQMDYIIDVIIDVRNSMQAELEKKEN